MVSRCHDFCTRDLPRLDGVVNRPVLLPSGEFHSQRGYIPELNTFLLNSYDIGLLDSVDDARDTLLKPFSHFQFVSDSDKACAFAYLFSLLLREWIGDTENVPAFHFGSARGGTGKGLLSDSLYYIAHGTELPKSAFHRDEEALKRSVGSALLSGVPGVLFDNLSDGLCLSSVELERLLTARIYPCRVLFQTLETKVTVRAVFALTGNNLTFSGALPRRIQHCLITTDSENPENRKLPDLTKIVRSERSALLGAALTIVKAWHDSGCPDGQDTIGSFVKWSQIIGGVLGVAGIDGFNPKGGEVSDRDMARKNFVRTVFDSEIGRDEWAVKDILGIALIGDDGTGQGLLTEFLTGDPRNYRAKLGYVLRTFANQVFEYSDVVLRVERVTGGSRVKYRVSVLNGVTDPDSEVGF